MTSKTVKVCILGATGTIGLNTLDVIRRHSDTYEAFALSANNNVDSMLDLCREFTPRFAVMADEDAAERLSKALKTAGMGTEVLSGRGGLEMIAAHAEVDSVMAAIVGAAGLLPTLAAARAGKRVMLANKESLVMSGQLFMDAVSDSGAELLPIDSEHNAIFQCMPNGLDGINAGVSEILLTASGGPFRTHSYESLQGVTPEQACAHPNWVMGRKISVDSATMMNKGLEVIEACWLFGIESQRIQVVVHPQSVIHSMVSYNDGSVLAQMGNPDMRTPIAYALGWPERIDSGVEPLDIFAAARLDFEQPDFDRFPCLRLAYEAYEAGGTATAILNAANEIAVSGFLDKQIGFLQIASVIEQTLKAVPSLASSNLDAVLQSDTEARDYAQGLVSDGKRVMQ